MEQTVIIAYAILLMINTVIFLLCAVQMRKFSRFYRNFNKVVSNVQAYLQYVMEEPSDASGTEASEEVAWEEDSASRKMQGIVELDQEIPDLQMPRRENDQRTYGRQARAPYRSNMPEEQKEAVLNSVLGELFS